jgi:protein-S-isoprenylcysteine O-methyltransferase Ste14
MENKKDNPGVLIPPPLLYAAIFFLAILLQKIFPLGNTFFNTAASNIIGAVFITVSLFFIFPALLRFLKSKNTLITVKPAHSLQAQGIYSISRNPMYLGLLLVYTGLSFILGNWWNLVLIPVLIFIVQGYVIKREEKYLARRFGQAYIDYTSRVRRWL